MNGSHQVLHLKAACLFLPQLPGPDTVREQKAASYVLGRKGLTSVCPGQGHCLVDFATLSDPLCVGLTHSDLLSGRDVYT